MKIKFRLKWVPPPLPPQASVAQTPWGGGGPPLLSGEGLGGPSSEDWTNTLVLYKVIPLPYGVYRSKLEVL
jgi:hypothetical protein